MLAFKVKTCIIYLLYKQPHILKLINTNIAEEIKSILCIFGGHYLDIKLNGQFENSQHLQHICLKQAAI